MASLCILHKSKTLIPKSRQSTLIFNRFCSSSNSSENDGNAPVNSQQSPSKGSSFEDIRKNLSAFRRPASANRIPRSSIDQIADINPTPNPNPNPNPSANTFAGVPKDGSLSFQAIRENIEKMRENKPSNNWSEKLSLNHLKEKFQVNPTMPKGNVIGGSIDSLPNVFGKEIKEQQMKKSDEDDKSKYDLARPYTHDELGEKLKELRPNTTTLGIKKEKEGFFSLSELQQRLGKLKEMETKDRDLNGDMFVNLRKSIKAIELIKDDKPQNGKLHILSQPGFMSLPPKDHLVEKYFHPDNMSSAEKLKIKLKKVREEFKMSDTDCGSTRVQIAQLTTEIHHLSSVLHKKDKHSRRGLHLKVQQRKKLLKYLRRTDWDSYCFVLSKLGLRDNPDYKN